MSESRSRRPSSAKSVLAGPKDGSATAASQQALKTSVSEIEPAESSRSDDLGGAQPQPQHTKQQNGQEDSGSRNVADVTLEEGGSLLTCGALLVAIAGVMIFALLRLFSHEQQVWGFGMKQQQQQQQQRQQLWSREQLMQFSGEQEGNPLYLAILGEVFDVSKGGKFYSKEAGYSFFTGRDASRAFVTGEFKDDLTDDVSGLSAEQCLGLVEWRSFYRRTYTPLGRLVGRFYDSSGQATPELQQLEALAQQGQALKEERERAELELPGCSMRWSQAGGGAVWCEGGMYPRKVFQQLPGGQPNTRCACFKELGWSDYRQLYPDCAPDAHECVTAPPEA